jgi:hypothetical protein
LKLVSQFLHSFDEMGKIRKSLFLLPSRMIMFLLFQALIALLAGSFAESQKYWLVTASATNVVSILILISLIRAEGGHFLGLFRFAKETWKKDLPAFLALTIVCGPVVFIPNHFLSIWIFGDDSIPFNMMFQPVSLTLTLVILVLFPVTIAFAELATYFAYIMPRLKSHLRYKWLSVALPVAFLAIQHCTLPFIPDLDFVLYRALVYLPFALVIGIALYFKPPLFPYFAVLHGILDFGTVMVLLSL